VPVSPHPRILYVTNPFYEANGREYAGEDVYLSGRLAQTFDVHTCLPTEAVDLMAGFDAVVVRNSGPVLTYPEAYAAFRERALATGQPVYNELSGKADMLGKQYLLDLHAAGFPVIPSVSAAEAVASVSGAGDGGLLPASGRYVVKPLLGADSVGLSVVSADQLASTARGDVLVQPLVDVAYEVSLYFVDHTFVYALRTPDAERRWLLEPYVASEADLVFARRFVDWNDIEHGVQRVDACRTTTGELLLVELEDLNPFLSLDRTTTSEREGFVQAFTGAIGRLLK
jgi:hypothetical protein